MVKHTQTIRWQKLMNCLSVFDYFLGLALNRLTKSGFFVGYAHVQMLRFEGQVDVTEQAV